MTFGEEPMQENTSTIELICNHTSVRDYEDREVEPEVREKIIDAARHASTTCFFQVTSVIRVSDPEKRKAIADITTQPHVYKAPELWIFCADFTRVKAVCPNADTGFLEQFLYGVLDTGLFAQNAMIALESLGLGGVYAGAIRRDIARIAEVLELPATAVPVVGICFGYPACKNEPKPRFPSHMLLMDNVYREPSEEDLKHYDEITRQYFASRGANAKESSWSREISKIFSREQRAHLLGFLRARGWCQK